MKRPQREAVKDETHPSPGGWMLWALGALEEDSAKAAESHARACATCRGFQDAARSVLLAAFPGMFEPVPRAVRRLAEGAFATAWARVPAKFTTGFARLRLARASEAFNGGDDALAASGLRGEVGAHRCTLEGGAHRIDLEWMPEGGAWKLRGRVATAKQGATPRLLFEFRRGRPRRVVPGPRGFFGPIALASPEVRVTLESTTRSFRSVWVPPTPRPRRVPRG